MSRSSATYSLTWYSILSTLAVLTVVCASCKGKDYPSGKPVFPMPRRDSIGVAIDLRGGENGIYSAPATVGSPNPQISLVISTHLGDFVAVSTSCQSQACKDFERTLYDPHKSFTPFGNTTTQLFYGADASSVIGHDSVTIGGLFLPNQTLAAVESFNRSDLFNGSAGILGLGFPLTSKTALLGATSLPFSSISSSISTVFGTGELDNGTYTSDTVASILHRLYAYGPIVPSLFNFGGINEAIFSLNFNRNFSGGDWSGLLTIGSLPNDVDSSSLTWLPVRLYENGTLPMCSSKITAVVDSTATATGGPKDAIDAILDATSRASACNFSHTLSFQLGGKLFPLAPQDFLQVPTGNRRGCLANVEAIDSLRSNWSLYTWRLGSSFLRSNLVAFDYGSLTHPSTEPPRMGFMSLAGVQASSDARWSGAGVERCWWLTLVSVGLAMILYI